MSEQIYDTEYKAKNSSVKRLTRSKSDRMLGGVCSGLARYFGLDAVLVRVIFAIAFFGAGVGFLPYILLWVIMPEED